MGTMHENTVKRESSQFVYPTTLLYDEFEQVLYSYFFLGRRLVIFFMLPG